MAGIHIQIPRKGWLHVKKFLAALIIGAFTLGGIGCSGEKDKKVEKEKVADKEKEKITKEKDAKTEK